MEVMVHSRGRDSFWLVLSTPQSLPGGLQLRLTAIPVASPPVIFSFFAS